MEYQDDEETHPLENDLIVETLSKFISRRDLLRCRLVCHKWHIHLLPRLRLEFQVRIDDASLGKYSTLSRFLSLLLSSGSPQLIPYGSYFIIDLKLSNPLLQKLFTICGPLIKNLRIQLSHQNFDLADVYALRELLIYRAINLQSLSISGSLPDEVLLIPERLSSILGYNNNHSRSQRLPLLRHLQFLHIESEGGRIHPQFIQDLLTASPNLKKLKSSSSLSISGANNVDYSTLIIETLLKKPIQGRESFRHLSSLHLASISSANIQQLSSNLYAGNTCLQEFSFKLLRISFSSIDEKGAADKTCQSLENLLQSQKDSLRELRIGEVEFEPRSNSLLLAERPEREDEGEDGTVNRRNLIMINFPVMKNLRRLFRTALSKPEVRFNFCVEHNKLSLPLPACFATMMPNLEELEVRAFSDELNWEAYFSEVNLKYPCNTLKKLTLPSGLDDPNRLEGLSKMFPNVRSVTAESFRNPVLSKLWSVWPQLSELSLTLSHRNEGIDSVFTGIPETTCELLGLAKGFDEIDLDSLRVGPSIASLRGLRKLHVETSPIFWSENLYFCDKELTCFLTNITGFFALAYLTQLEDISINCCEISEDCCHYLSGIFKKFTKMFVSAKNHVPVYEYDELQ